MIGGGIFDSAAQQNKMSALNARGPEVLGGPAITLIALMSMLEERVRHEASSRERLNGLCDRLYGPAPTASIQGYGDDVNGMLDHMCRLINILHDHQEAVSEAVTRLEGRLG